MDRVFTALDMEDLSPTQRRKVLFEEICPLLRQMDIAPAIEEEQDSEEQPEEGPRTDEEDETIIDVATIKGEQSEQPEDKKINEQEKPESPKAPKGRSVWKVGRFILASLLIVLLVFIGLQAYPWVRGFITGVVQPMLAQDVIDLPDTPQMNSSSGDTAQAGADATGVKQSTVPPQASTLFSDDFNTGLSSGWQVVYGKPIAVNGVLTADQDTLLMVGDTNWKDYAVEFDADAADCWFSWSDNWLGVQVQNTDNLYAYKWSDCESYWFMVSQGAWNEIPQSKFSPGYERLRFRIQSHGGNLSVYVEEMLMSSFYDNSYSQGRVALKIAKNTVIDNFVIKELD